MATQKSNLSIKYIIFFFLIFFSGILLRLYNLNLEDYWLDEQAGFYVADPTIIFSDTLERVKVVGRGTNLVFNLILKKFFYYFGYDPNIGRVLPFIFGILCIPALSYLSFQINKNKSFLITSILCSFNFYLISYSQETRLYSLLFLVSILNLIFFFKLYESKNLDKYKIIFSIFYTSTSILGNCSHVFFFIITFSQIIFLFIKKFFDKEKIFFNLSCVFVSIFFYILLMYDFLFLQINIKEFWMPQISIDFFYNFFFSRFFGSKIMGVIYLAVLLYLIYRNRNLVFKYNSKYFLLILILTFSYLLPVIYSIIQKPVLTDRYIIFVLIPVILLISNLIFNIKNNREKIIILFIILGSSVINNYIEIFNREISKPEFSKSLGHISKFEDKNVVVKTKAEITERIIINYAENIRVSKKNNINFLKSSDEIDNLKNIWFICYQPINGYDCSPNNYIFSTWKNVSKINHKLIVTYLYEK